MNQCTKLFLLLLPKSIDFNRCFARAGGGSGHWVIEIIKFEYVLSLKLINFKFCNDKKNRFANCMHDVLQTENLFDIYLKYHLHVCLINAPE